MALKKNITTPSGASAEYWRICGLLVNEEQKSLEIYVAGYVDEKTRRATKEDGAPKFCALAQGGNRVAGEQWDEMFSVDGVDFPPKATLYAYLKTLPEWAGASDA